MTIFGSGHQVVTSLTRPASPLIGQLIYQTDTDEYLKYVSYGNANRWMQAETKSNRNKITNGGLDIWQRGTTLSGAGYIADRFYHDNATTVDRQTDVPANAGFRYSIRHFNSLQLFPIIRQRIEGFNATNLAGKTLTISFWAKSGTTTAGTGRMYVNFNYPNALDNYATKTNITNNFATDAWVPDATWRFYSFSFLAPSQVSNGLEVEIVRHNSATTTFVTGVQVEVGTAPSEFEFESYEDTLRKCQRYYFIVKNNTSNSPVLYRFNYGGSDNLYHCTIVLPVTPRITNGLSFPVLASPNQIHKPMVRWDVPSSLTYELLPGNSTQYQLNIVPSVNDGAGFYGIYLYGIGIIYSGEI
jgi:hypothetical protein